MPAQSSLEEMQFAEWWKKEFGEPTNQTQEMVQSTAWHAWEASAKLRLSLVQVGDENRTFCAHCGLRIYAQWRHHGSNLEPCYGGLDTFATPAIPSAVQGEELPEMDVTEADTEAAHGWITEAYGSDACTKTHSVHGLDLRALRRALHIRERQLRAYGAEIRRLKGERDRLRDLLIESGKAAGGHLLYAVSAEFLAHIPEEISLALSASRADALKEASECASSYFGHEGWGEEFRNAGNAISAAILARMEKAS